MTNKNIFPAVPASPATLPEVTQIYHYASANAAIGVASNKAIWGSKIQFLNDDQEFREYIDFIIRVAENHLAPDGDSESFTDELFDRIDRVRSASIYVASFSEENDRLSQWRGYCPDGGYALGFDRDALLNHFEQLGYHVAKASYTLPAVNSVVGELRALLEAYRSHDVGSKSPDQIDQFFSTYVSSLWREAPRFKHQGFQEEAEWRVYTGPVAWDDELVDVVNVRGALRPIYKFPLPQVTIPIDQPDLGPQVDIGLRTVRVAPGKDAELRLDAMRIMLRRKGLYYDTIIPSTLPYNAR